MNELTFNNLPLGMGATLGNFIRRSVYCIRRKWDIIGFSINNLHEFSPIPHSTDIVTDFLPKLKDLDFTLKPALDALLSAEVPADPHKAFNLGQYADSVALVNTTITGNNQRNAVFSLTTSVTGLGLSSKDLERWFDISTPMTFCQTTAPVKLDFTLYIMKVQGTMPPEETFSCLTGVKAICLPASNRGSLDVSYTYEEHLGYDVLNLKVSPDTPENRRVVREANQEALQLLVPILKALI